MPVRYTLICHSHILLYAGATYSDMPLLYISICQSYILLYAVLYTLICRSYILLYAVLYTLICQFYILLYAVLHTLICRSYILLYLVLYILLCRSYILVMVLNTTFSNISVISWKSVLLVEATEDYQFILLDKTFFFAYNLHKYAEYMSTNIIP